MKLSLLFRPFIALSTQVLKAYNSYNSTASRLSRLKKKIQKKKAEKEKIYAKFKALDGKTDGKSASFRFDYDYNLRMLDREIREFEHGLRPD